MPLACQSWKRPCMYVMALGLAFDELGRVADLLLLAGDAATSSCITSGLICM